MLQMKLMKIFSSIAAVLLLTLCPLSAAGQTTDGPAATHLTGDLFESHGGYAHGFLSVGETYCDNILYTPTDELADWVTRVSPGLWVSIPGGQEEIPNTATASSVPGGVVQSSLKSPEFRRLLAYLSYTPEFEYYRENSDENTTAHLLKASVEYRFPVWLSGGAAAHWRTTHEDRRTDNSLAINEYTSELFRGYGECQFSPRVSLEIFGSYYALDFDEDRNAFRNRIDYSAGGDLSYALTAKTDLFARCELVVLRYDEDWVRNGEERNIYGGFRWDVTDKSSGSIGIGWGKKDFVASGAEAETNFRVAVQIEHQFTAKTGISLDAYRRTEETNISFSDYRLTQGVDFLYTQQVRSKLLLSLEYFLAMETYRGGSISNLEEVIQMAGAGVTFAIRKWFSAGVEYTYSRRASDLDDLDFTANEVVLGLTLSL